jgi:hypothetical protein
MRYSLIFVVSILLSALAVGQVTPEATGPAAAETSSTEYAAQGLLDGRHAARQQPVGGRFVGGFAAGLGLGLIGTGVVYAIASGPPEIPGDQLLAIADRPAAYQQTYQQAYRDDLRKRRQSQALMGGLAGTAVFVTVFLAVGGGG